MREIDNDAREEARFRHAQQESREVKLRRRAHKGRERGNQAPRDEDAGKPFARAPTFDEQRAGDFEDEVTDEEDADSQAENFLGEFQVAGHAQFGKADVGAVQIRDDVKQEHQRHHSPRDLAAKRGDLGEAHRGRGIFGLRKSIAGIAAEEQQASVSFSAPSQTGYAIVEPIMQTNSSRIAIIDWSKQPVADRSATLERAVIGDAAEVRTYLCNGDADFDDEILDSSALMIWHNMPITRPGIVKLKRCKAIVRIGVGFDTVDVQAAAECNIPVCNVPDYGTEEVADHAIALAMALCRKLFPLDPERKRLGWQLKGESKMRRLRELAFGIVGLGRIGTATALRAKALGFKVCFYDPYLPNGADKAVGLARVRSFEDLLRQADVLSIHCPLTAETRRMITARELGWMKPSAFIVNTARGAIIEKAAILASLREGRLAGAGLDVVEDEPLRTPEEAPTPNLIVTCHAAFCSVEAKKEMRTTAARIARAAVLGEPLENVVNRQQMQPRTQAH